MVAQNSPPPVAVLGPTNTGKTHLAIERMCAHSSGMIGFPLRLLAREVYDRVAAIKGPGEVGLITGEEKILPPRARWLLCTAESMPLDRETAFVAIDEAQLGADPERGHIFTDRLLHARGREETMILGSATLRPLLRRLVPEAEIISRPRFSNLSYAGSTKLSRLPPRSAIVAFSAEEVYAVAEMLRRLRGGAAVVMGALSPQTRNAQVAMFQAGEVDYLVATDAIGMGLNMDVAHVAFAALSKFDGRRQRRLTVAEMAQIAGRAGRHQRDGTFGALSVDGGGATFTEEEIAAIEAHMFAPLDHLFWRESRPRTGDLDGLIADLERRPDRPELRAPPEAIDLAVLKMLAEESWVRDRARGTVMIERLWTACGLPDFRKTGASAHSRLVSTLYRHLSEANGYLPAPWFADQLTRLESVDGDVETLADRLAGVRTWAYIAQRRDWLAEPEKWAERARAIETRLSDALHQRLTQRFVDRRTSILMRDLGARGADLLPVTIGENGEVAVEDSVIGRLEGFSFKVDPEARHAEKRRLLAAAERRLGDALSARAAALVADSDVHFSLATEAGRPAAIFWKDHIVARLERGRTPIDPRITLHKAVAALGPRDRDAITLRLKAWLHGQLERHLPALRAIGAAAQDPAFSPRLRALCAALLDGMGMAERDGLDPVIAELDRGDRGGLKAFGVRIGALHIFNPVFLKPEPTRWRMALAAVQAAAPVAVVPPAGAVCLVRPADVETLAAWKLAGFHPLAAQMVRIDMVERIARLLHEARLKGAAGAFVPDPAFATSLGVAAPGFARLLSELGFRSSGKGWIWRGRKRAAATRPEPAARAAGGSASPFAALAVLKERHG